MENLNKEREADSFIEKKQVKLLMSFIKKERDRFNFADTSQWLAFEKKEQDLLVLADALTAWTIKIDKGDPRHKELMDLLKSVWSIGSYCSNLETICQSSVSKYIGLENEAKRLSSEKREASLRFQLKEKEYLHKIETLEKEIEFTSR